MLRRTAAAVPSSDRVLQPIKQRLIDAVFSRIQPRSFADLGGVWAVEAGYTFYGLENSSVERAVLVDTGITETVRKRAKGEPRLEMVEAPFGTPEAMARVDHVDAVFMFDVLLHQVKPNWDEVLRSYAEHTDAFLIVDPQWTGQSTVRLLDLGLERYREVVPPMPMHDSAWDQLDKINPQYGRPWRDIHEIWQWGIVESDVKDLLEELGFSLMYYEDAGSWNGLENFDNHAFGYVRKGALKRG